MRKLILIGRHGERPLDPEDGNVDDLLPQAYPQLYDLGRSYASIALEERWNSERAFLVHSNKKRTKITGQILLGSALDVFDSMPLSEADVVAYDGLFDSEEDERLSYDHIVASETAWRKYGGNVNINYWLQNPEATEHEGEAITPWTEVRSLTRGMLHEQLLKIHQGKGLGAIMGHVTTVEPSLICLVESTGRKVETIEELCGSFAMGEVAELWFNDLSGGLNAELMYRDNTYPVDLDNI
ncbi:MAG: hypothetical protein ACE5FT_07285 [Candidatus Nanoarchaeia archaeon]